MALVTEDLIPWFLACLAADFVLTLAVILVPWPDGIRARARYENATAFGLLVFLALGVVTLIAVAALAGRG